MEFRVGRKSTRGTVSMSAYWAFYTGRVSYCRTNLKRWGRTNYHSNWCTDTCNNYCLTWEGILIILVSDNVILRSLWVCLNRGGVRCREWTVLSRTACDLNVQIGQVLFKGRYFFSPTSETTFKIHIKTSASSRIMKKCLHRNMKLNYIISSKLQK